MEPNQLGKKIKELEEQVLVLIDQFRKVKEELNLSRQQIAELNTKLITKEEEFKNFQNQYKITKIVQSLADETHNRTELKLKINEYIREIDRCIAHLSE